MEVITEEWVSLWYQCLLGNLDYMNYCDARRDNDKSLCQQYEFRFEHIAGIYRDFGDVDIWPDDGIASDEWREWYVPRKHLFISDVAQVANQADFKACGGHILIDVPVLRDRATTEARIAEFLDGYFATPFVPAGEPQYKLHMNDKGKVAHGIKQVRNACIVQARCYVFPLDPADARYDLNFRESLAAFLKNEIDKLDWVFDSMAKADAKARADFMATGELTEDHFEKFKSQVNRCRRDYKSFAANVIRNRFPDLTPFDSKVIDHFER